MYSTVIVAVADNAQIPYASFWLTLMQKLLLCCKPSSNNQKRKIILTINPLLALTLKLFVAVRLLRTPSHSQ
jgi:hypothetical protein